jgi:hypothetical protein
MLKPGEVIYDGRWAQVARLQEVRRPLELGEGSLCCGCRA